MAKESVAVGYRAAEKGHVLQIDRQGKRFRVVCSCDFRTHLSSTRKTAFAAALEHAVAAAQGEIPGVSDADIRDSPGILRQT